MAEAVEAALDHIIAEYGLEVCEDARRVEALLRDLSGEHRREISILGSAVREGIPAQLRSWDGSVPGIILVNQLARVLEDNVGLGSEAARWGVVTWAAALGVAIGPEASRAEAPAATAVSPPTVTSPPGVMTGPSVARQPAQRPPRKTVAPAPVRPRVPATVQVRNGAAIAGALLAVGGGILGLIGYAKFYDGAPGSIDQKSEYAYYIIPAAVGLLYLVRARRHPVTTLAILEGACWPAVFALAWDLLIGIGAQEYSGTFSLSGDTKTITAGDACLLAATVLLLIAIRQVTARSGQRRGSWALVGGVLAGQIATSVLILSSQHASYMWFGCIIEAIACTAIAVYAVRLGSLFFGAVALSAFALMQLLNLGTFVFGWSQLDADGRAGAVIGSLLLVAVTIGAGFWAARARAAQKPLMSKAS